MDVAKPLSHHLKSRFFLGDKKHRFAVRHAMGDEICDRLALAGARWALEDKTFTVGRRLNCGELR